MTSFSLRRCHSDTASSTADESGTQAACLD
jgi:hypothetical protein